METSLHRELKKIYAGEDARTEVPWGPYRIDAVQGKTLVEIQFGSLGAIRRKIGALLKQGCRVTVVKPLIAHKTLVKLSSPDGSVVSRRKSPKRATIVDIFDELIHFTEVFPHKLLTLEIVLVEIEEWRVPGHGRRRRWGKNDFEVLDRKMTSIVDTRTFKAGDDLREMLPPDLPEVFHTGDLSAQMNIPRWLAQRIGYCLRKMSIAHEAGKSGNALLYKFPKKRSRSKNGLNHRRKTSIAG